MITLDDIKKLYKLQEEGYQVLCNGERVFIIYDPADKYIEKEEHRYTFTFKDEFYIPCNFENYKIAKWEVKKIEEIDWRNL